MGEEEKEEEEEENIDQNATTTTITTTTIDHNNDDRDDEKQHQNNCDGDVDNAMNVDITPPPPPPTTTTTTTTDNNNNKDVEEEEGEEEEEEGEGEEEDLNLMEEEQMEEEEEDLEAMEEEGDEEDDGDDGGDDDGDGDDDEDNNNDEDNTNDENNEEEENDEENDDEQEQERGPKILAKVTNNEHIAISSSLQMTEQQRYALRQQVAAYAHICQQLLQITHEAANALPAKKPHAAIAPTTTTAKVIMKDSPNNNNIPISTHQQQQSYQHKILPQIPGRPIGFTGTYEKSGGTGKPPASVFSNTGVYRSGKARWTPSPAQFKRLEEMFAIDTTTPQREHLTSVTLELSALGPVQEANVYNWFQNKKARLKARAQEEEKRRLGSLM